MKKLFLLAIVSLFFANVMFAQTDENTNITANTANQKFLKNNYEGALDDYLFLLENNPKTDKYNYNIAICYLNTNINKSNAISYLEKVIAKPKHDPNAFYLLGRAYHFAYRFDDAIKAYSNFKHANKGNPYNLVDVDREIQFCFNAKELLKFPLNVKFENLGEKINSPYADYYAFVPNDESFIVFNTRRPEDVIERMNEDGTYPSLIYISKSSLGDFSKAKNIGPPIEEMEGDQEVIGLSANGETLLLYYTNAKGEGDIYLSTNIDNKGFSIPEKLNETINSSKAAEIAASITSNGNSIYFASNRLGGIGGTDLYVSRKLPNGKWGAPQNLGPEINTNQNEDFPTLSADGKLLYFSSNGHTSIGGYDIFKAELNENSNMYTNPKNVGYPINTPEDNYNFRLSSNGNYGYVSALRDGGFGDMDIYRITFNVLDPQYSVVKGRIFAVDSSQKINFSEVSISVRNIKTKELIGNYLPNPYSGHYVIVLAPGNYHLEVVAKGFVPIEDQFSVLEKNSYKFEITNDIPLNIDTKQKK